MNAAWYFTANWHPVLVRRGDALGFRAGSDYFAELLAPGLSNSTVDARWITLLSWCLKWSHVAWRNAGGGNFSRRDDQQARYAWLRPLELLWIARTLKAGQSTGQLRGRRSIERWFKSTEQASNFSMSADQFRRYRQVGTYGAYRVVFRNVPGLTHNGDGWTPADVAHRLAEIVNDSLPEAARLMQERFENGTKWGNWRGGEEARYWLERGWQTSWATTGGLLPTPEGSSHKRLPIVERRLLGHALFGADSIRGITAEVLASAKYAKSHADLCDALASASILGRELGPRKLAPLPAFSRFADAAMDVMRGLWDAINSDDVEQAPPVQQLVRSTQLQVQLEQLREASHVWLKTPARSDFPHQHVVTLLAEAVRRATTQVEQLRALAQHHQVHGGGRNWFREQAGNLVPLVADTGISASDYRFRLQSLCRLAAQCGLANMRPALHAIAQQDFDDDGGDTL
jgi:hypothetical protein